ncbi:MAG TPA: hypothetical protein VFU38_02685 [Candidatus Krumholzibacteria bacterium]|nr:hypothetical protein [Candidatus Krumholzibacteria bacterium]
MSPRTTRFGLAAVAVCAGLQLATPSRADDGRPDHASWRLAVGPLLGGLAFDPSLDNYRWDTSPALQAGVQATVFYGRLAAGARAWRARTTQATGFPGETQAPRVALTSVECVAQGRMVSYRGVELWGAVHGGRLFLAYDPDQLTVDTGIGSPITVAFDSIAEWDYGFGIEIRGDLTPQLALALQADRSSFSLDTAHRSGDDIVLSRERFDQWSLRVQASWLLNL